MTCSYNGFTHTCDTFVRKANCFGVVQNMTHITRGLVVLISWNTLPRLHSIDLERTHLGAIRVIIDRNNSAHQSNVHHVWIYVCTMHTTTYRTIHMT